MKSLFLRILLWFWLTLSVIGVTTVLFTLTEEAGPFLTLWRSQVGTALALYGEAAMEVRSREGAAGLATFFERLRDFAGGKAYLIDQHDKEVTGRPLPAKIRTFAGRVPEDGEPVFEISGAELVAGLTLRDRTGTAFVIVREMPRRPFWHLLKRGFTGGDVGLRLVLMITVVGLLSYGLGRYLTRPILGLQSAVRRFAGGDLAVRVAPLVQGRRDEIAQLGRDFDHMAERIESLMRAQQRLLRDISHELRSPLARMAVALELAKSRAGAEAQPNLERIEREAGRLNQLIGQLLTLVRMESGVEAMETALFEVSSLVGCLVRDEDFEARGRNRSVTAEITAGLALVGNEELVRRALENVLRNAVRYTAEHSAVEVNLTKERIDNREWARLSIRDHGPGVPRESLRAMFLPFRRIGDARERDSGGVGLGLAIADHAVRAHHGSIWAENADGGGLRVVIRLPLGDVR